MTNFDHSQFDGLTFEDFRRRASDARLSKYEKIGFPDCYRKGFEERIFLDVRSKLTNLDSSNKVVLDVGPGVSDLPLVLAKLCERNCHALALIDSAEMLAGLPDFDFALKVPGRFPDDCADFVKSHQGQVDAVLVYSVLQYVFVDASIYEFVDQLLSLLAEGGQMLLGDIPNIDKRKRFFSSPAGVRHHQTFTGTDEQPKVRFNTVEPGKIDDSVVLGVLARCRRAGFDAYVLPQCTALPMANRREDILVIRP